MTTTTRRNEPGTKPTAQRGLLLRTAATLWGMLRQRCPRCRQGRMFRGQFAMNDPCPVCGLLFQREEGYFLGSRYTSYVIGCAILFPFYYLLAALFPNWSGTTLMVAVMIPYLAITPAVFRYSRVVWIYFDRAGDPWDVNACAYEKAQRWRFQQEKASPPSTTTPGVPGTQRISLDPSAVLGSDDAPHSREKDSEEDSTR